MPNTAIALAINPVTARIYSLSQRGEIAEIQAPNHTFASFVPREPDLAQPDEPDLSDLSDDEINELYRRSQRHKMVRRALDEAGS